MNIICGISDKNCQDYDGQCQRGWALCEYQIIQGMAIPVSYARSQRTSRKNDIKPTVRNFKPAKLPFNTDICQCSVCGEVFNSTFAFDYHRTGDYTDRRCLTTEEMRDKGMVKNHRDRWISAAYSPDELLGEG